MFLAFLTLLAGPLKLRIFAIVLEGMGRFLFYLNQSVDIYKCQPYVQVHIVFTHGQLEIARIVIPKIFNIRSYFDFDEKILENKAEKPIQILDYRQVLSYRNRL